MLTSPHVLLAEDEDLVAAALAEVLESYGFRVTIARDGQEALLAHAVNPADALVTDMRMPRMGGLELIQAIRETDPDMPVVVTTGYSEAMPTEEPGRLMVIMKPYQLAQVASNVRSLLSRSRGFSRKV
ncbi:response regulator [Azospirillum sp.]|uniref:response regulator n=1 Tax=Azospirillum sp. TaxID=34012 RepID=UPI002D3B8080|nr:response regulator [Azospirillum sp.]HYF88009.1 response regulator [Azospirillum sp.]